MHLRVLERDRMTGFVTIAVVATVYLGIFPDRAQAAQRPADIDHYVAPWMD
jgi:hypothetical protein